jgi:short subunit dehydrogenase-like uncharacterized protein
VLLLHDTVRADGAGDLGETTFVLTAVRGGLSGGTLASLQNQLKEASRDAEMRRASLDPYGLSPRRDEEPDRVVPGWPTERDAHGPSYDETIGQWTAPFVMAAVNTRVVRRSNALQDWAYGREFRYREVMGMGGGPLGLVKSTSLTGALAVGFGALALPPTRSVLSRLLPKPGEGPSERTRTNGYFRIEIHTTTSTGRRYCAHVAARGDPGYAATAVMFGEAGLALAVDAGRLPGGGGVLTPATGLGRPLLDRLRDAGQTYAAGPS